MLCPSCVNAACYRRRATQLIFCIFWHGNMLDVSNGRIRMGIGGEKVVFVHPFSQELLLIANPLALRCQQTLYWSLHTLHHTGCHSQPFDFPGKQPGTMLMTPINHYMLAAMYSIHCYRLTFGNYVHNSLLCVSSIPLFCVRRREKNTVPVELRRVSNPPWNAISIQIQPCKLGGWSVELVDRLERASLGLSQSVISLPVPVKALVLSHLEGGYSP